MAVTAVQQEMISRLLCDKVRLLLSNAGVLVPGGQLATLESPQIKARALVTGVKVRVTGDAPDFAVEIHVDGRLISPNIEVVK